MGNNPTLPRAKKDKALVVQELPDEALVYDRSRQQAHYLNAAAALVWKHCDGKMKVTEMAQILQEELGVAPDGDHVETAVGHLRKCRLVR